MYICKSIWTPVIGQELQVKPEDNNEHDKHAVSVIMDNRTVGHLPRTISCDCAMPLTPVCIGDPVFIIKIMLDPLAFIGGPAFIRDQLLETGIYIISVFLECHVELKCPTFIVTSKNMRAVIQNVTVDRKPFL